MSRTENLSILRERIDTAKDGSVFVASDFADITENIKISVSLFRLDDEGVIKRIMHSVYYKPEYSTLLAEYIAPDPDAVAHAIARKLGWTIVPCGDIALNFLGLSTKVPTMWSYVSDGMYKQYTYDNTTIKFKRTTNKEISKLSPKTALVIQALRALGKEHINSEIIRIIKSETTHTEKKLC